VVPGRYSRRPGRRRMHMNGIMKGALVTVGGVVRRSMVVVATRAGTSLFPVGADLAATAPTFRSSYLSSWNVRVRRRNDTRTTSLGSIVQGKLLLNEIETTNLGLWGGAARRATSGRLYASSPGPPTIRPLSPSLASHHQREAPESCLPL
jgi:hypothetical protein